MQAIVLAGGLGTRMRPLTYTRPKPLLPILNRTLLERVLDAMPPEVDTIVIPVNYLADQIRATLRERPDDRVVLVDEPQPLGSAGAIKNCEKYFDGPILVYNADIVSSLDLASLVRFHVERKAKATISLWRVEEPWHFGVVRQADRGRIVEFVEKPKRGTEPSNLANAGHYMIEQDLLDDVPKSKFMSLEAEIFTQMAARGEAIYGLEIEGYWVDCGRPETYLAAHRLLLNAEGSESAVGRDVEGLALSRFFGYAVGDRAHLGAGAIIERSVVLPEAWVGHGAQLRDCIVGAGAHVGRGARLEDCTVADGYEVDAGSVHRGERLGMREADVPQPVPRAG